MIYQTQEHCKILQTIFDTFDHLQYLLYKTHKLRWSYVFNILKMKDAYTKTVLLDFFFFFFFFKLESVNKK